MGKLIINKSVSGVRDINDVKDSLSAIYMEFVNAKDGITPAMARVLGGSNVKSIMNGLSSNNMHVLSSMRLVFFRDDYKNHGDAVLEVLNKTKIKTAIVTGIDEKGTKTLEDKIDNIDVTVMITKVVYDGYVRSENACASEKLYSFRNDFKYERVDVYSKKEASKKNYDIKKMGEDVFKSYGQINRLLSSNGKRQIYIPTIERKVSKRPNGVTTVYDNCYMANKSESFLVRTVGFSKRMKDNVVNKSTVFYDMKIKSKEDRYVSDALVYVDLVTASEGEKDIVLLSESAKTDDMIRNGFYGVTLKEKVSDVIISDDQNGKSRKSISVSELRESFMYFLNEKDAIKCSEATGAEVSKYEVATSSQSQSMNNKAVFVRCDLEIDENIILAVEKRLRRGQTVFGINSEADCLYPKYLRSLRGRESLLEMATALSFGTQMSNEFINWVEREHKEIDIATLKSIGSHHKKAKGSGVTANIRAAMSLSNSNGYRPEGGVRINKIGSVKYILTNELAKELCEYYKTDIDTLRRAWKAEKLDGQSIVRKSFLVECLKALGLNKEAGSVQSRVISQKGMLTAVPDDIYDALGFTGDVTVEAESYKYAINNLAQDMFEISLINTEKGKVKCRLNQQYIDTFAKYVEKDGIEYNDAPGVNDAVIKITDKYFDELESALDGNDISALMKIVGLYHKSLDEIEDLNLEEGTLDTKAMLAVKVAGVKAVDDGYIKSKIYETAKASFSKLLSGGIMVDGAVKYVISDPTAILRTDLMVKRKGDTLVNRYDKVVARLNDKNKFIAVDCIDKTEIREGDIVISNKSEVALSNYHDAMWLNSPRTGEVLLMRTPNPYEGESQKVNLIDLSCVNRYIDMIDKDNNSYKLDCMSILSQSPDTLILSGFNVILESLGGADTDGDRVHIILDEDVVSLRPDYRHAPIYITEAGNAKKVEMDLGFSMIPDIIKKSLEDDYTGVLTNTNTRIVEIKRIFEFIRVLKISGKDYMKYLNDIGGFVETFTSIKDNALEALSTEDLFYDFDVNGKIDYGNPLVEEEEIAKRWSIVTTNDDLEELIELCTKTTLMIKRLQEKAISSAKTGIYVRYETIKFLRGDGRMPYWFTPGKERTRFMTSFKDSSGNDMSVTPMDAVFRRIINRFEAIDKKVYKEYNEDGMSEYSPYDYDYGFEDYLGDEFDYEYDGGDSSIPKSVTYSVSEELAKIKHSNDTKMKIILKGLDIKSYKDASVLVSKLGEVYSATMSRLSSIKTKSLKKAKMDSLIATTRDALAIVEEEYGFTSTYMAAYNCSDTDNNGNKLPRVSKSFSWIICPDKLFALLNSHFVEKHTLMTKDEAIKKGYSYTVAYDKYVAVDLISKDNIEVYNNTASRNIANETLVVSVHGINKKYNKKYEGAQDALLTNFSSLTKEVTFDVVKADDTIELHYNNNPVFTQITANCAGLDMFNKVTVKASRSQYKNFGYGGKSVKLMVISAE